MLDVGGTMLMYFYYENIKNEKNLPLSAFTSDFVFRTSYIFFTPTRWPVHQQDAWS